MEIVWNLICWLSAAAQSNAKADAVGKNPSKERSKRKCDERVNNFIRSERIACFEVRVNFFIKMMLGFDAQIQ